MKRYIFRISIIFLLSLFVSWVSFYFFISEVISRIMESSTILNLSLILIIAFILYTAATTIISKEFNEIHIDIIAVLYFLVVIGLSFFKSSAYYTSFNLNPLSIVNEFEDYFRHTSILLVSNALIYLPLGVYTKLKIKNSNLKLFFGFLLYILLVEIIQSNTHTGIFDINDILANTIGFFIGVLICNFIANCCKNIMQKFNKIGYL